MPDYTIKGKDGRIRRFVGLAKPPSPEELDAIEAAEAPKDLTPINERMVNFITDAASHPFESVIPKDAQMKVASAIAGSPQQENEGTNPGLFGVPGLVREAANMFGSGGTASAFWHQPLASARGLAAGAAEGGMDLLSPFNMAAALVGEEAPSFGKGFGPVTRAGGRMVASTARRGVQAAMDAAGSVLPEGVTSGILPDIVGIKFPRIRNAMKAVGAAQKAEGASAVPAELREVYEAIRSQHGDAAANGWLKQATRSAESSAGTNAAGATKPAARPNAPSGTLHPRTGERIGPPVPEEDGPWGRDFLRKTKAEAAPAGKPAEMNFSKVNGENVPVDTMPGPEGRGQPVKAANEAPPTPKDPVVNDATGETESQWRARMNERITKANETAKGAKNPTRTPAKSNGSTGRVPEAPADMESMVDRMNGGKDAPLKGNGTSTTTTTLEEDISNLRRKYGAERIGTKLRPDAPEVGNGVVTRNDMNIGRPAQSWAPDIAQQALLRDLKAGSTKDPSKTLRALSQVLKEYKRNGGAANSPVARELQQLLKAHGFLAE